MLPERPKSMTTGLDIVPHWFAGRLGGAAVLLELGCGITGTENEDAILNLQHNARYTRFKFQGDRTFC